MKGDKGLVEKILNQALMNGWGYEGGGVKRFFIHLDRGHVIVGLNVIDVKTIALYTQIPLVEILVSKSFAQAFFAHVVEEGIYGYCPEHGYIKEFLTEKEVHGFCNRCGKKLEAKVKYDSLAWGGRLTNMVFADDWLEYLKEYLEG